MEVCPDGWDGGVGVAMSGHAIGVATAHSPGWRRDLECPAGASGRVRTV
jgi:hypothetical protein